MKEGTTGGTYSTKNEAYEGKMRMAMLNCNGFNDVTRQELVNLTYTHRPEVIGILESKMRQEQEDDIVQIPNYRVVDIRRSDLAGDKSGGGILVYTRESEGLNFKHKRFNIKRKDKLFVQNERVWVTVESKGFKTAYCLTYLGFQCSKDRHGIWNDLILEVIEDEARSLKEQGFRLVIGGDMNAWVGNNIKGNDSRINKNGERLLSFLERNNMFHLNGDSRTEGVWTRHDNSSSTVLDYVCMENIHKTSVKKMYIDENGVLGGGSDHVWIIVDIVDKFERTKKGVNKEKKKVWNFDSTTDWKSYKKALDSKLSVLNCNGPKELGKLMNEAIYEGLEEGIGEKEIGTKEKKRFPKEVLGKMKENRRVKSLWRELRSEVSRIPGDVELVIKMMRAEVEWKKHEEKFKEEMNNFWVMKRTKTIEKLADKTIKSNKLFWSFVKNVKREQTIFRTVEDPASGELVEGDNIQPVVEEFLRSLFEGSFSEVKGRNLNEGDLVGEKDDKEEGFEGPETGEGIDLEADVTESEVQEIIEKLKNNKAEGVDRIPAEALKNGTPLMLTMLTRLFNIVKVTGVAPDCWKVGRVVLLFKAGERTELGNYRPLTVLPVVCGVYSKVMNRRLTISVEQRNLLGELQQGFRKDRCGSDNTFILNTILMKAGAKGGKAHLAFVDLKKAYDTVSRLVLWQRMKKMGFGGTFLNGIQAMYQGDNVVTDVNGKRTRSIFLGRGLRQGCSLSPCLFALYMVEWGKELESSKVGFRIGAVVISALFFADDVLLISRTSEGLKKLLLISTRHCKMMRMQMSTKKSQVISPSKDTWDLFDDDGNVYVSLDKVLSYKYLGVDVFNTLTRTSNFKQKKCILTAKRYKAATRYLSRRGPDVVDISRCAWSCVAIPALTFGTEFVLLSQTTIDSLERVQGSWAKETLGLPIYTPNLVAQVLMGVPTVKEVIWNLQLKAFVRLNNMKESRLAAQALWEHRYGGWDSPYLKYINSLREKVGLLVLPEAIHEIEEATRRVTIQEVNEKMAKFKEKPVMRRFTKVKRARSAMEGESARWINRMIMGVSGVNLAGGEGEWQTNCKEDGRKDTELHCMTSCVATARARKETGVLRFFNIARMKGIKLKSAYRQFVTGMDEHGNEIDMEIYMNRGEAVRLIMKAKFKSIQG